MRRTYRIYPGIGIARIGNSTKYFIGPESPYSSSTGPFKERGMIKKQAARFRVYEFEVDEFGNESIVGEVLDSELITISWNVHLVNRKAAARTVPEENGNLRNDGYERDKLIIEGRDSISGKSTINDEIVGEIQFIKNNKLEGKDDVVLGHLETDAEGRLIIVGGNGVSKSPLGKRIPNFANNDGWYDDCCDGPVQAEVVVNGTTFDVESSWIVVGSPAYAPDIKNVTTWFDQAKSVNASSFDPGLVIAQPSFTRDIFPILLRASQLRWVSSNASDGHGANAAGDFTDKTIILKMASNQDVDKPSRVRVFNRLTEPNTPAPRPQIRAPHPKNMPLLYSGIDPKDRTKFEYASLTPLQHSMMERWADGDFNSDWDGIPPEKKFDNIPFSEQPLMLNEAALSACIGGPFYPGIESTYLMALTETYESPYRIKKTLESGALTELMALPWQADFIDCGALWWPAQRPVDIRTKNGSVKKFARDINGHAGMVKNWSKLGFVVKVGNSYVEKERGQIT